MEYNPLDKANLGVSVRDALLRQPAIAFAPEPQKFSGSGIYSIYYRGTFPAYERIASRNRGGKFEQPIYVGKADPRGARKGGLRKAGNRPSNTLYKRLQQHARSIREAENLLIEDFFFRYLVVDDIWIPLGETYIIDKFEPLWNKVVIGFGIHTPGERRKQNISIWDTLHPGRSFVAKLGLPPNPKSIEQIQIEIDRFLSLPPEEQAKIPVKEDGGDDDQIDDDG